MIELGLTRRGQVFLIAGEENETNSPRTKK